jgi:hypothetical protein
VHPEKRATMHFGIAEYETIPADRVQEGRASLSYESPATDPTISWRTAGCPDDGWSARLEDAGFLDVELRIEQAGQVLFVCTAGRALGPELRPLGCVGAPERVGGRYSSKVRVGGPGPLRPVAARQPQCSIRRLSIAAARSAALGRL